VRKVSIALGTVAAIGALSLPASALAAQQLTLTPSPTLTGKPGGSGTIFYAFTIANTLGGLPSPLSGSFTTELPAGVTYAAVAGSAKLFPKCSSAVINAATGSTPPVCPAGSQIGTGSSTFSALIGTQTLNETSTIKAYLTSSSPVTLTFWGSGTTPIAETKIFTGTLMPDSGLYGEKLITNIPTITTVPGGPDASVTQFSLSTGGTAKVKEKVKGKTKTVTVPFVPLPKKCASSQLHWSASTGYEDGTTTTTTATTPCTL